MSDAQPPVVITSADTNVYTWEIISRFNQLAIEIAEATNPLTRSRLEQDRLDYIVSSIVSLNARMDRLQTEIEGLKAASNG